MELVCAYLDKSATDFQVESYSGQQFVLLANLMIEAKVSLHWHLSDEELKTSQYITDLNSRKPQTNYVAIETDGLHFHTCFPRQNETGRVVELEKVCGLNLDRLCLYLLDLVIKQRFIGNQVTGTAAVNGIPQNAMHGVELGSRDGEQFRQTCLSC